MASEIDGGCMQTASASSKCPRSHVKAGILAAMKIPPSANRAPSAQTYLELPDASTGRRRMRRRIPTPQPIAAMDPIVRIIPPADRSTHSP